MTKEEIINIITNKTILAIITDYAFFEIEDIDIVAVNKNSVIIVHFSYKDAKYNITHILFENIINIHC